MPKRIHEDHKHFRDVVNGRTRKELKRLIKGKIVRLRAKGGKIEMTIPGLDIPHFAYGDNRKGGVGRGKGKKGQVIGRDPKKGEGSEAGDEHQDGITVQVDLEDVLRFLQDELQLPDMKPKPSETYEEVKTIYNDISKTGPDSLRHTRRTLLEALKRLAMTKNMDDLHYIPGHTQPIRLITPINSDRRYRQYQEIKIPSSNAVIFFMRDCSASMDDYKCEIVSDMAWWLDVWITKFYERVERSYIIHDTEAKEVSKHKFYSYRQGGGTMVSSAFKHVAHMIENKFPAHSYNVYIFYFGDGENWGDDNQRLVDTIKNELKPVDVNMIGFTQICSYSYGGSVKEVIDNAIKSGTLDGNMLRTVDIGGNKPDPKAGLGFGGFGGFGTPTMAPEERDRQIMDGLKSLLGKKATV